MRAWRPRWDLVSPTLYTIIVYWVNLNKLSRNFVGTLRTTTNICRVSFIDLYLVFPRNTRALVSVPCIPAIRFSNGDRSTFKFVKDQWNVSHDSLIHACSLSASWFGKKSTFLGVIILIFFACALRHCRVMTGYYVTLKYQAKLRTIAWKVFATLKCLDSTWFCLANMDFRHLFHWENYISKKPPELNGIEANCALKINIFRYFAVFLELTFYFYSLYFFFVHDFFRYARAYRLFR